MKQIRGWFWAASMAEVAGAAEAASWLDDAVLLIHIRRARWRLLRGRIYPWEN